MTQPPAEADRRIPGDEFAAAVRPGGTLLVVGHDRTNLQDGVGGPQDPGVLFTPNEVAAELCGFTVVRSEVIRRPSSDARGPIDAVVCAVRGTDPDQAAGGAGPPDQEGIDG